MLYEIKFKQLFYYNCLKHFKPLKDFLKILEHLSLLYANGLNVSATMNLIFESLELYINKVDLLGINLCLENAYNGLSWILPKEIRVTLHNFFVKTKLPIKIKEVTLCKIIKFSSPLDRCMALFCKKYL